MNDEVNALHRSSFILHRLILCLDEPKCSQYDPAELAAIILHDLDDACDGIPQHHAGEGVGRICRSRMYT